MRVTVIKQDGLVGVDGVFRSVNLSGMPEGVGVMQWDGEKGHVEYLDRTLANTAIDSLAAIQSFVDLWNAAAPVPVVPTPEEMISGAYARINAAYEASVKMLTAGYPDTEVASWPKQEAEARAYLVNKNAFTPWLSGAASARGMNKANLSALIVASADALAPMHGALTGKRQALRDRIAALGTAPTQAQLDAIQW